MELTFKYVSVNDMVFSNETAVRDGTIYIDKDEMERMIRQDPHIENVRIDIARPGESVRIMPVKDVLEPRIKLDEQGGYFALTGVTPDRIGRGETLVLKGAAVVLTSPLASYMEGILDMSGEAARYTPFSKTCNLVLWIETKEDISFYEKQLAQHMAARKAALCLAEHARDHKIADSETFSWEPERSDLPRYGLVHMFTCRHVDTLVYGKDVAGFIPPLVNPLAAIDGGIECLSCRVSAHRPPTFYHENNPSVMGALRRHGKELNFVGVLVSLHENTQSFKEKNAHMCVELMKMLQLDCAIIIEENKGNPDVDLMLVCKQAERAGIKIVLMTDESAGEDGASQGMADIVQEADAIVTNGNCNAKININPMERVLGDPSLFGKISGTSFEDLQDDGSYNVELLCIPSACNQMGYTTLTCVDV